MSFSTTISVSDHVQPVLERVPGIMDRARAPMARSVANHIKAHFARLDASRANALGGKRTHFYAQAARGTQHHVLPDGFVIGVNQVGIRQRWLGGKITAKNSKFLTIPASPEAYGKRAREFNDLRLAVLGGKLALVKAEATQVRFGRKRKDGSRKVSAVAESTGLEVMYWLKRSVNQQGDSSVMPGHIELLSVALRTLMNVANRQLERKAGSQ